MEPLKKIQQDIKKLESYRVITSEELSGFLSDVANILSKYTSSTKEINKETKDTLNLIVKQVNEEHNRIVQEVKDEASSTSQNIAKELKLALDKVNYMCEEVMASKPKDGKDGENGLDADEEKVMQMVLEKLPPPKELEPETTETIAEKLNKGNGILNAKVIKGLTDFVTHVLNSSGTKGDSSNPISILLNNVLIKSGVSKINFVGAAISQAGDTTMITVTGGGSTFYTETPSGLIDGSNVTYTVLHTINTIMSFAINGMFLHEGTDFTKSGVTLTFLTPLDASLSGKPFTIIYT
jgi:hypothetical protein